MNKVSILIAGCLLAFACWCEQSTGSNKDGLNEMKRIEKHLLENRESITFSKPSDFTAESFQEYKNAHLKSSITVKRRKDVPDDFKYIISFDDEKECYWVEVLGGVAMVYEIHGPFSVSEILEICKGVGPRKVLGDEEE